jgi:pimeloyl-ACP methyl ester carboxylesterase
VTDSPVRPFTIHVPDSELADLRRRLAATRWPDQPAGAGWSYGADLAAVRDLAEFWRTSFDWRQAEAALNQLPHEQVLAGGQRVHVVHVPGRGPAPLPLVLTHGWPSSFFEFAGLAERLADPGAHGGDPADAFHVVIPDLPGYGFSGIPAAPGMSPRRIAGLWVEMMGRLGYERFGAHGGDWGSYVTGLLGYLHPAHLVGAHMTMVPMAAPRSADGEPADTGDESERTRRAQRRRWRDREGGYAAVQRTKPQTLSYGLMDSPAGTLAWIVEKWRGWSDCGGDVLRAFSREELLTNVAIYWHTATIASSVRLYYEAQEDPVPIAAGDRVRVPAGFLLFRRQGVPSRARAAQLFDVRRWTVSESGGHFAGLERPDLLVDELREFFRPLRA